MFRTADANPRMAGFPTVGPSSASNPIDLTMDDDEDDLSSVPVATFGPRPAWNGPYHEPSGANWHAPAPLLSPAAPRQQPHVYTDTALMNENSRPTPTATAYIPPDAHRTAFGVPNHVLMQPAPIGLPPPPLSMPSRTRSLSAQPPMKTPQVIDLTSSPSPPPFQSAPRITPAPICTLPADLPQKTPVCIGQLSCTALVLYPIPYICPQAAIGTPDGEWAPVRYMYEHNPGKPLGTRETIHIKAPDCKSDDGELKPGEKFGVFEQRVATSLGPMLGKGLIRVDAKVRRQTSAVSPLIHPFSLVLEKLK